MLNRIRCSVAYRKCYLESLGDSRYSLDASRRHGEQYAAGQEMLASGNIPEAKAEFERLSNEGPRIYRAMARMEHAGILVQEGDLEGALAGFDPAAEVAHDAIMRESAQIRAAYIAADTQDFAALRTRLNPLIASNTSVSYLAKELLGVEAWDAGDTALARQTFDQLVLALGAPDAGSFEISPFSRCLLASDLAWLRSVS